MFISFFSLKLLISCYFLHLNRKFFFCFEIEFFSKRVDDVECENCLLETRKKIKEFFDYADCSGKDEVTAE